MTWDGNINKTGSFSSPYTSNEVIQIQCFIDIGTQMTKRNILREKNEGVKNDQNISTFYNWCIYRRYLNINDLWTKLRWRIAQW